MKITVSVVLALVLAFGSCLLSFAEDGEYSSNGIKTNVVTASDTSILLSIAWLVRKNICCWGKMTERDMNVDFVESAPYINVTEELYTRCLMQPVPGRVLTGDKFSKMYSKLLVSVQTRMGSVLESTDKAVDLDINKDLSIDYGDYCSIANFATHRASFSISVNKTPREILEMLCTVPLATRANPMRVYYKGYWSKCPVYIENFDIDEDGWVKTQDCLLLLNIWNLDDGRFAKVHSIMLRAISARMGLTPGNPNYEAGFDINGNNVIDYEDFCLAHNALSDGRSEINPIAAV